MKASWQHVAHTVQTACPCLYPLVGIDHTCPIISDASPTCDTKISLNQLKQKSCSKLASLFSQHRVQFVWTNNSKRGQFCNRVKYCCCFCGHAVIQRQETLEVDRMPFYANFALKERCRTDDPQYRDQLNGKHYRQCVFARPVKQPKNAQRLPFSGNVYLMHRLPDVGRC